MADCGSEQIAIDAIRYSPVSCWLRLLQNYFHQFDRRSGQR